MNRGDIVRILKQPADPILAVHDGIGFLEEVRGDTCTVHIIKFNGHSYGSRYGVPVDCLEVTTDSECVRAKELYDAWLAKMPPVEWRDLESSEKENEAFLRKMRQIGVKGEEESVGLDRAYLLLDALDAERARMDMMVQAMETIAHGSPNVLSIRAIASVALDNLVKGTPMTLKTGDTLRDNDPRANGATLAVVTVGDTHAICKRGSRRVQIALARIFDDGKPRRTGFTVLPSAPEEA